MVSTERRTRGTLSNHVYTITSICAPLPFRCTLRFYKSSTCHTSPSVVIGEFLEV